MRTIVIDDLTLEVAREILARGLPENMQPAEAYPVRCGELSAALRWLVEAADAKAPAETNPITE